MDRESNQINNKKSKLNYALKPTLNPQGSAENELLKEEQSNSHKEFLNEEESAALKKLLKKEEEEMAGSTQVKDIDAADSDIKQANYSKNEDYPN